MGQDNFKHRLRLAKEQEALRKPVQIDISDLPFEVCRCGNTTFVDGVKLKVIPANRHPELREDVAIIKVLVCPSCGHDYQRRKEPTKDEQKTTIPS